MSVWGYVRAHPEADASDPLELESGSCELLPSSIRAVQALKG